MRRMKNFLKNNVNIIFKKSIFVAFSIVGISFILTGCKGGATSTNHSAVVEGSVFNMEDMAVLGNENYENFIHRRFLVIWDDAGVLHYIRVNNNVPRHNYDWNNLIQGDNYLYYGNDGIATSKIGVDVSKHQGNINWNRVATAGIDYAIVRLGFRGYKNGAIVKDEYYDQNMSGANAAQIPVGVYFYSQAINYDEGVEEAQFVLNNLGGYAINYPIVYDTEDAAQENARTNNISVTDRTDALVGFCETIKAAGYEPVVYAGKNWIALSLDMERLKTYKLWYAQYADVPELPYNFIMWQYTNKGTVDGINGEVDLNIGF